MTIAEFFISLGIKGSEKAKDAIKEVKRDLTDLSAAGIASKAALVGTVYALERFMIGAAQAGTGFTQFANLTGISTDRLQRWQYALMQSGVEAQETQKNIENVQTVMGKMLLGKGAPEGMAMLNSAVGFDYSKAKDTMYVMDKLRQYLKQETNITKANEVGLSFGLSPAVIQALRTSTVELDKISKNELLSDSKISKLNKVNIEWMNFWRTLKLFQSNLVADYGIEGIKALQNSFHFLTDVVKNVYSLIKAFPELKTVVVAAGIAIMAVFAPMTTIVAGIIALMNEIQSYREGKDGPIMKWLKPDKEGKGGIINNAKDLWKDVFANKFMQDPLGGVGQLFHNNEERIRGSLHGVFGEPPSLEPQKTQNNAMNIKIDNHGVEGADEVGQHLQSAINFAFRQFGTTGQVT